MPCVGAGCQGQVQLNRPSAVPTTLPMPTAAPMVLAQTPPPTGPSAATIFYITLLFIFLTAIVTTVVTKWARDKVLKFFNHYHVTLERTRGQTSWGKLKVFSSGIE